MDPPGSASCTVLLYSVELGCTSASLYTHHMPAAPQVSPDGFGSALRRRRIEAGLTLRDLAARVDLSPSFLSQVERDITRPRLATLQRIAEEFDTSMHAIPGAADPTPQVSVGCAGEGVRLPHHGDPEHGRAAGLVPIGWRPGRAQRVKVVERS